MSGDAKCGDPWIQAPEFNKQLLDDLKKQIKNYTPPKGFGVTKARMLMVGQVGAGKSSFVNAVNSTFMGHITSQACSGNAQESLTTEYRMYQIRSGKNRQAMNFRLHDTRGIETDQGGNENEMCYLLDGNVPDGYQFNPSVPFSSKTPGLVNNPLLSEKIHCVVFVIDGTTVDVMSDQIITKMKKFMKCMSDKGIPQIVLLTKIDRMCKQTEQNLSNVFYSTTIRNTVDKTAQIMGLPRGHVFPIKNYESEMDLDDNVSILALLPLRKMLHFADDFIDKQPIHDTRNSFIICLILAVACYFGLLFYKSEHFNSFLAHLDRRAK